MALNKFKTNASLQMQKFTRRDYNRCIDDVLSAVDEAARTMEVYKVYLQFLEELEGAVSKRIMEYTEIAEQDEEYLPIDSSRGVNSSRDIVIYPNGQPVTDIDIIRALDYMYGTDHDRTETYTTAEIQRAVDYWLKKTDG